MHEEQTDIKDLLGAEAGNEGQEQDEFLEPEANAILKGEYVDPIKEAMANVLTMITNSYYRVPEIEHDIKVVISNRPSSSGKGKNQSDNFYNQQTITLAEGLMDAFKELNLPRFGVYYHELAHHLYSQGYFDLMKTWHGRPVQTTGVDPLGYHRKYDHLANWIEDLYIEDKMIKEIPYTTDILTCIKAIPPGYNINDLKYAFNHFYVHGAVTPALTHTDGLQFLAYINKLLMLRNTSTTRFGKGVLSVLTATGKRTTETQFVLLLIEFYNWCEAVGIFDPQQPPMPELDNPNEHLESPGQGGGGPSAADPLAGQGGGGSYSQHTGQVGKATTKNTWIKKPHISVPTNIFKNKIKDETTLIQKELLDMSQRLQVDQGSSLEGLFNAKYHDSSFIQNKIILPNFFNPARLLDMVLFKEKEHIYTNVAIYRDISGSVNDNEHKMMSMVCDALMDEIPVQVDYYLYSSGKVSIVKVDYVQWEDADKMPPLYQTNPMVKQLQGGTNSDAIADAITEQLSENWLNIIVTDGDLHQLMRRSNIEGLLKNVFVVHVSEHDTEVTHNLLGVLVNKEADINQVIPLLSTINQ